MRAAGLIRSWAVGHLARGWHARSRAADPRPVSLDLRLVPAAGAAWLGAWCGTLQTRTGWWSAAIALTVILVGYALRRSPVLLVVAVALIAGAAGGALRASALREGPIGGLARERAVVATDVVTAADAHRNDGTGRPYVTVRATAVVVEGRGARWRVRAPILVTANTGLDAWQRLPVGTRVFLTGRLEAAHPGDEFAAVMRARGTPALRAPPGAGLRLVERVRAGLRASVASRSAESRALVPALVLGDTSRLQPALTDDFRATGLSHLTAVSGANLTLLLAFLLTAGRWLGVRGRGLRLLGVLAVVAFVGLCRTEPSVLRAAAMGLVALAALIGGGRASAIRHLAVTVLGLVLIDPFLSRSPGFALSVLASAGIVVLSRPWADTLNRWLPRVVAEAVAVPLAAQLATMPMVAALSGQVSVVGLLANALAGPLVGPATVLGFAAAGTSLLSTVLASAPGIGAAACAHLIITVAHVGASFPGAAWSWPAGPAAVLWLIAAGALAAGVASPVLARPWLSALLALALLVALLRAPTPPGWPPRDWLAVACDIGQGDGLVVRAADHAGVVFDAGPDPVEMGRCLDQLGIREVPLLVLTHFHADHVAGIDGVFAHRRVGQIWVSPLAAPASEARQVTERAAGSQVPVASPRLGATATVGAIGLRVIGPVHAPTGFEPAGSDPESSAQNDSSLVLMVTVAGVRLLFAGDVEPAGQAAILRAGSDVRADVLKIPHHGSARQDAEFFAATHARVAMVSAGRRNSYGHPAPRTLKLAQSLGMTVLRTDTQGDTAVAGTAHRLRAVAQLAARN